MPDKPKPLRCPTCGYPFKHLGQEAIDAHRAALVKVAQFAIVVATGVFVSGERSINAEATANAVVDEYLAEQEKT